MEAIRKESDCNLLYKHSQKFEKCFSWNACDDVLRECINRSEFVKQVRHKLMKKKNKSRFQE